MIEQLGLEGRVSVALLCPIGFGQSKSIERLIGGGALHHSMQKVERRRTISFRDGPDVDERRSDDDSEGRGLPRERTRSCISESRAICVRQEC